jgi:HlyD family secretion protein
VAVKLSRQNVVLTALGGTALALLAWGFLPTPVEVDLGRVSRGALAVTVDHEGKTRVRHRYVVSSPLAGRLLRIGLHGDNQPEADKTLHAGDRVEANKTLLAVIEPADPTLLDVREHSQALARRDAAAAARKKAASDLERAGSLHNQAKRALERDERSYQRQGISQEDLEKAHFGEQAAAAALRSAEFAEQVTEFEYKQAEAALVHTQMPSPGEAAPAPIRFEILAPISGVVLHVYQESATVVTPGFRLVELGDSTDLECEVDVLSSDAVRVREHQRVIVEHWGGERPLQGQVRVREPSGFTKVSALGVEEQRVNIIIDLTDPPSARPTLGDGYRIEARIVIWEAADVVKVPAGALFRRGGAWAVFRVEDGHVAARTVKIGHDNGLEAEVLGGLTEGDRIVLHPSDRVTDGVAVRER